MADKRIRQTMILLIAALFSTAGCAVRRDVDGISQIADLGDENIRTATTYRVETSSVELGKIMEVFLNQSVSDAEKFYYHHLYEMDGKTLTVANSEYESPDNPSETEPITYVGYWDDNEGAYSCYSILGLLGDVLSMNTSALRNNYPEENLDACTKEEAMEACLPYAEACGYGDAEVLAYGVTLDIIEKKSMITGWGEDIVYSAPGPGYEVITYRQIYELEEEGRAEEADILRDQLQSSALHRGFPWKKKHEAMILIYQKQFEGFAMDTASESMLILYVPLYGRPIYVNAPMPSIAAEKLGENQLISKDEALEQVLIAKGYSSAADIEVQQISLVYALQQVSEDETVWDQAIPCWQIEYSCEEVRDQVLIDAVYGDLYTRYPNY